MPHKLTTPLTQQWLFPAMPLEHVLLTHGIKDQETPGNGQIGLQGPGRGHLVMNSQNLKENTLRKLLQQKNLLHLSHKHEYHQQQGDAGAKEQDGRTAQHLCLGLQARLRSHPRSMAAYLKDLGVLQHNSSLPCRSQLLQHSHLLHSERLQRKIYGSHGSRGRAGPAMAFCLALDGRRGV